MATVADIVALPHLALTGTHLTRPEAAVRWVATSELADPAPFLEGGEVLLTTGLATGAWTTEWEPYVARLVAAGVVALGLATGLTHHRPPAPLIAAARRHGLNLLEVPRATTFVAISQATAGLLAQAERRESRDALRLQRELTTAALADRDGSGLPAALARLIDGGVGVADADGRLLNAPVGPHAADLDPAAVAQEVARIRPSGLRAAAARASAGGVLEVHPLGVRARPSTYLAAWMPGGGDPGGPAGPAGGLGGVGGPRSAGGPGGVGGPGEARRGAVRTAVALLGLATERAAERRDADTALRARALELLIGGDERGALLVLGAASVEVRVPATAVVVRAIGGDVELPDGASYGGAGVLVAPLATPRADDGRDARADGAGVETVAVLAPTEVEGFVTALRAAGHRVGIGEPTDRARIGEGYRTAGHALARTTDTAPTVAWDRVVREGVIGLLEPARAHDFASSLLAPLADAPLLQQTLLTFLVHHGSRLKVAEELGVHRNTVRHRLDQVERLTGLRLDDAGDRVSAWIALQALPLPLPDRP